MKQIWAPWRGFYINTSPAERARCFLCAKLKERRDKKNLIVKRGEKCFALMNLYPYNAGHLLIAPIAHKANLENLTEAETRELFGLTIKMKGLLDKTLKPEGFNLGFNLGDIAGAGLTSHLHLHIVPRWKGDTNFMPVISSTKVISQSLPKIYNDLRKQLL